MKENIRKFIKLVLCTMLLYFFCTPLLEFRYNITIENTTEKTLHFFMKIGDEIVVDTIFRKNEVLNLVQSKTYGGIKKTTIIVNDSIINDQWILFIKKQAGIAYVSANYDNRINIDFNNHYGSYVYSPPLPPMRPDRPTKEKPIIIKG